MSIMPLPQFEEDLRELEEQRSKRDQLPSTIVVQYGRMKMVGEFPFGGRVRPGCGSKIVVRTYRGTEMAELLTSTCPNSGCGSSVSRKEMLERFDEIEAFADIGRFIDQPVKTYSSGMRVRLAFSVQVQLTPDVLIIDEALSVGDNLFQKRCHQRLTALAEGGTTLLFVSHSQEAIRTLTTRAIAARVLAVSTRARPTRLPLGRSTRENASVT